MKISICFCWLYILSRRICLHFHNDMCSCSLHGSKCSNWRGARAWLDFQIILAWAYKSWRDWKWDDVAIWRRFQTLLVSWQTSCFWTWPSVTPWLTIHLPRPFPRLWFYLIFAFLGEFGTPCCIGPHRVGNLDLSLAERCQNSGKRAVFLSMDWWHIKWISLFVKHSYFLNKFK